MYDKLCTTKQERNIMMQALLTKCSGYFCSVYYELELTLFTMSILSRKNRFQVNFIRIFIVVHNNQQLCKYCLNLLVLSYLFQKKINWLLNY